MSDVVGGLADVPVFVVGVASVAVGGQEGAVAGVGEVEVALAMWGDVEEAAVDELVAAGADADEVVGVGFASSGPPGGVVHLEVRVVASRCCALATLTGDDRAALLQGGEAVGPADVEDISVAA